MPTEKILFLGYADSPVLAWLKAQQEDVVQTDGKITPAYVDSIAATFLINFGYSHIHRRNVLEKFPNRAINLHISYLPWNRGADPNFWSFVEGTPKGVTIHYLDEGIDTGDIIAQKELQFDSTRETLATTYQTLLFEMAELFKLHWAKIKAGTCERHPQIGSGTIHRVKDKERLSHLLVNGWNTPVSRLENQAPIAKN